MAKNAGILLNMLLEAKAKGKKLLAVLIDPDKFDCENPESIKHFDENGADVFLIGGSLLMTDKLKATIACIKTISDRPVYLFPSSPSQIDSSADGILFLSLLSGRNPDLLIGKHVEAAPILAQTDLEVLSTGYLLIDCGNQTTAHYMSQSAPIPYEKDEIAVATALAGSLLNLQCLYLDGGSGAARPISSSMIEAVHQAVHRPLIIGGGIRSAAEARSACEAGADMIVVGNALEQDPGLFQDLSIAVHSISVARP